LTLPAYLLPTLFPIGALSRKLLKEQPIPYWAANSVAAKRELLELTRLSGTIHPLAIDEHEWRPLQKILGTGNKRIWVDK